MTLIEEKLLVAVDEAMINQTTTVGQVSRLIDAFHLNVNERVMNEALTKAAASPMKEAKVYGAIRNQGIRV